MTERLTIDFAAPEVPRRNLILKEQINFSKCSVLGLWQTEEAPSKAEKVGASVEESRLRTPVPSYIELVSVSVNV
jgi:hypothetical protein